MSAQIKNEELVELIQAGINKSQNLENLYFKNMGLILSVSNRFCSDIYSREDLTQEAFISLCRACTTYDFKIPFTHISKNN